MQKIPSLKKVIVLVTERSEDTGLALSVVRRDERSKFIMKDYFSFEKQRAIAEKLISSISGEKIVETNKKVREKSL